MLLHQIRSNSKPFPRISPEENQLENDRDIQIYDITRVEKMAFHSNQQIVLLSVPSNGHKFQMPSNKLEFWFEEPPEKKTTLTKLFIDLSCRSFVKVQCNAGDNVKASREK